jgi:hypothetical protein
MDTRHMKKKPPKESTAEFIARLETDPRYLEMRRQQEARRAALKAEYDRAEAPLVAALKDAGCEVKSVWDLVNGPNNYAHALHVLLEHLERRYPPAIREGIARALAVKETRQLGWPLLMRLFEAETEKRVKDGVAVALCAAADNSVIDEVITLASDARHGTTRVLLLDALDRSRDPRASAALERLQADPDLVKEMKVLMVKRSRRKRK